MNFLEAAGEGYIPAYKRVDNAQSDKIFPSSEIVTEQRGDVGTEADYRLLLNLKTEDFQENVPRRFFAELH